MYEYPNDLVNFLVEQESDGNEIITTQIEDGTMWIIPQRGLSEWVIVITWYEGQKDYQMINVCGKGYKRLKNVLNGEF